MRVSHNTKMKKRFIKFRNKVRNYMKALRDDFKKSNDKELNKIVNRFNVYIAKWSPRSGEAYLIVYDPLIIKSPSLKKLYSGDVPRGTAWASEWINFAYGSNWRLWELVNSFIMRLRDKVKEEAKQ